MKSLKVTFGGANRVSIDWNGSVEGMASVAQRAGVAIMTHAGSDKFLPNRGTEVSQLLFSYGVFDLMGMQHSLNFGALKARSDMRAYENDGRSDQDRVATIKVTLLTVQDNVAQVGVGVTNQAGQTTKEISYLS